MKKAWSILLYILLGAAVVGLGTGYFLHLANKDRSELALQAENAKNQAKTAEEDRQTAINQANDRLAQSNLEIEKAQETISYMEHERELLKTAKVLSPFSKIQNWKNVISTSLGVSLFYPEGYVSSNDDRGIFITASSSSATVDQASDGPWLSITPYDAQTENLFLQRISSSTPSVFLIKGHLLSGSTGYLNQASSKQALSATVLHVSNDQTSTHLIWIQDPPKQKISTKHDLTSTIEDILSTLDFKD